MSEILAIDLGGTAIKSAILSETNELLDTRSTPTPQNDATGHAAIEALSALIKSYQSSHNFDRVGLVIPGLVDTQLGVSVFTGTLGWRNLPITEALTQKTRLPVHLDHDVTAAGLAELTLGASAPFQNSVLIQIGTGIASAIVLNGSIYRPHQQVGEIGHASVGNDRPCPCGLKGCLEMTASGGAISRTYFSRTGQLVAPIDIFKRSQAGEPDAQAVWNEMVDALALSFSWLASTIAPEAIIMGGGISQAGEPFANAVEARLKECLSIHKLPKILISTLSDQAACLGAGLMARTRS
jgi:glucokinase